ncbi:MAG TPA: DUF305 domain-containing protein [Gemmatimonadaceae bacterium]
MTRAVRLATLLLLLSGMRALAAQHPADVRFMQGMIGHHAQALEMTALLPARTARPELRMLAERIDVSQRDEIAMMRAWLERHHQPVPDSGAHAGHAMAHGMKHDAATPMPHAMPGMLNAAEFDTLRAARGPAFDRHFLRYMIRHHEGALTMVKELLAQPGAGQDSEVYRFASDVDTDQRAEIARMHALLERYAPGSPRGNGSTRNTHGTRSTTTLPTPTHDHP